MTVFQRMIMSEFAELLLFGTILLGGIFFGPGLFGQLLTMMCQSGFSLPSVLAITAWSLPDTILHCMPAAVTAATTVMLVRMTQGSELVALRLSGIDFGRIIAPFLVMAVCAAVMCFIAREFVIPQARSTIRNLMIVGTYNGNLPVVQSSVTYYEPNEKNEIAQIVLVGKYIEKRLNDIVILDFNEFPAKHVVKLIWSKSGFWRKGVWHLETGRMFSVLGDEPGSSAGFQTMVIPTSQKRFIEAAENTVDVPSFTTSQLLRHINQTRLSGKPVNPSDVLDLHKRFARPLACILLLFAVFPLLLVNRRRTANLAWIYLGIVMVGYFLSEQTLTAMAENRKLAPEIAAWLTGICFAAFGLTAGAVRARFFTR